MNASDKASSGAAAAAKLPFWVVVTALSLLLGLQPITTDLYLPALPQMKADLGVSPSLAQWTLSGVMLAFGFGQLAWGPISDRTGRRPVLRWCLALFIVASLAATVAQDFLLVLLARIAQGIGMSGVVMCGRAMVRDLFPPEQGAQMMARGLSGLGVIALSSPVIGGLAANWLGWRATMGLLALFGSLILAFIWYRLPETLPTERRQAGQPWPQMLSNWLSIARHPLFQCYALLSATSFGGLFVYLTIGSFVFIDVLGVSRAGYGLVMASTSSFYLLGTLYCRRTLHKRGLQGAVRRGGWFPLLGGTWGALVSAGALLFDWQPSAWALLPGMWLYAIGHGINQPCGQTGVVAAFPHQAGAAAALSGFVLAVIAFVVAGIMAAWNALPAWGGTIHPFTIGMALGGALTTLVALRQVQRHGLIAISA